MKLDRQVPNGRWLEQIRPPIRLLADVDYTTRHRPPQLKERNSSTYALSENGRIALFQHLFQLLIGRRAPG